MDEVLNGDLLRVARQYRGIDQRELAAALGVEASTLSRAENGVKQPIESTVARAADKLGFPLDFFYLPDRLYGLPLSAHSMWRRKKSVSQRAMDRALAEFNIRMLHLRRLLRSLEFAPKLPIPQYEVDDYHGDMEKIAAQVRKTWGIQRGPIPNLTAVAETAGIFIFHVDLDEADIDGVTISAPALPPCVFLNKSMPADRMRFTLAHEIGHIVLHRFPSKDMEREASRFAGAFLVPQIDIFNDLVGERIDLRTLARLKPEWKVAMQSLLYRAQELGFVDMPRAKYLWKQFNIHRFRMREPAELDFEQEKPVLVKRLFDLHIDELGYTIEEMQGVLCMYINDITNLYALQPPKPGLRIVSS
jgi:Zn-dependent peptidase ImmA (M78 family)/transcriptional regulator with XRE-family HTH domain